MTITSYLAGAAQASFKNADSVAHPAALMTDIARAALEDAGIDVRTVDAIACVEPISWSYDDLAQTVADSLGCAAEIRKFWVPAGGTSPLDLLHQICGVMADAEIDCAVIAGAEALRTRRRAARERQTLDWPESARDVNPMRGQDGFSSALEQRHGLTAPIQAFPLFENAIRAANGRTADEQRQVAAALLAKNARVAADNPHAWFRDAPDAAAIRSATPDNRMIVYPYTKRMNAIIDVDQAAAVVVVSERFLLENDLHERAAAVLGGAGAQDEWFMAGRRTFAESPAMNLAVRTAMQRAGVSPDDLDGMDLYSCFPSAIQLGLTAAGVPVDDPRPFTLTGGLAYAGGPGNGYVVHALASALTDIRANPEHTLLVTGIGMANANTQPRCCPARATYRRAQPARPVTGNPSTTRREGWSTKRAATPRSPLTRSCTTATAVPPASSICSTSPTTPGPSRHRRNPSTMPMCCWRASPSDARDTSRSTPTPAATFLPSTDRRR